MSFNALINFKFIESIVYALCTFLYIKYPRLNKKLLFAERMSTFVTKRKTTISYLRKVAWMFEYKAADEIPFNRLGGDLGFILFIMPPF